MATPKMATKTVAVTTETAINLRVMTRLPLEKVVGRGDGPTTLFAGTPHLGSFWRAVPEKERL